MKESPQKKIGIDIFSLILVISGLIIITFFFNNTEIMFPNFSINWILLIIDSGFIIVIIEIVINLIFSIFRYVQKNNL